MTNKERMLQGKLYIAQDKELGKMFKVSKQFQEEYNQTSFRDEYRRKAIIKQWFGKVGNNYTIQPPVRCDYGKNIEIGENFYSNYDLIIIDVCKVTIGDNVMFGPRVSIYTAAHPLDPTIRNTLYEFGKPVTIGNNVWVGGSVTINPGVTIGDNVVIASGAVVTKDLESNAVYGGVPARKIKDLTKEDYKYWKAQYDEAIADKE